MIGKPGRRELFVWYRVDRVHADRARVEVEAMQRKLEAERKGLQARLLVRRDGDGPQTWMETYAMSAAHETGIDDALQARIEAAASVLREWLDSDRHVETFDVFDRA